MMRYRICWKSKITNTTGQGEWLSLMRSTVEAIMADVSARNPDLEYWIEEIKAEDLPF